MKRGVHYWSLFSCALMLALVANKTHASSISTISGDYDLTFFDTPSLTFHNTSAYDFTGAQMVLHAYQGLNLGDTATVPLPNIINGTDFVYTWLGPTVPHNLTAYDYDDEWGVAPLLVGNFSVTFTATLQNPVNNADPNNGMPIFSVFSPTTNATGGFVGWEGLDQDGLAETAFDAHQGSITGVLAEIFIGTPPDAPEPATITLLGIGIVGMAGYGWRRKKQLAKA